MCASSIEAPFWGSRVLPARIVMVIRAGSTPAVRIRATIVRRNIGADKCCERKRAKPAEQPGVLLGARSEIAPLDRHRMELRGVLHRGCDEQVGDLARVASFIVLRHDPLIDLEHLQVVPMDAQSPQLPEHPPRRAPAAQGNEAATALRARTADLGAQPLGGTLGCDFGGRKHMDAHTGESNESCGRSRVNCFHVRIDAARVADYYRPGAWEGG